MRQSCTVILRLGAIGVVMAMGMLGSATGRAEGEGICFGRFPTLSCTIGPRNGEGSAPPCSPETVTLCDASAITGEAPNGAVIVGDCFMGSPLAHPDVILGGEGPDIINAGRGNNFICAGPGNDVVISGSGDDTIAAEDGDDVVYGGGGRDVLLGGPGNDTLMSGNVTLGSRRDVLDAGAGEEDTCVGGFQTARVGCR